MAERLFLDLSRAPALVPSFSVRLVLPSTLTAVLRTPRTPVSMSCTSRSRTSAMRSPQRR